MGLVHLDDPKERNRLEGIIERDGLTFGELVRQCIRSQLAERAARRRAEGRRCGP